MSKLVNHFVICLDRSGSMQPIQRKAVDTFNQHVRSIREGAEKSGQESTVSLITFGGDINERFFCEPVNSLQTYDYNEYRPNGGTPLFDAVGKTIDKLCLRNDAQDENVSYVFIVITDGEENTSSVYPTSNPEKLCKRMAAVQKTDRWSFAFLLPPHSSQEFCRKFGMPEGNVKEWAATRQGLAEAARAVDVGITNYYTSRSTGKKSVMGFFKTDMTNVTPSEVKRKLVDIKDRVHIVEVLKNASIRDFVENELHMEYKTGNAYYLLMKDEKVQYHKQIILREKGKEAVYAGQDARQILGLPDVDVKVKPGDHANWDIFIQSTSVNRKLISGTKLVYMKS